MKNEGPVVSSFGVDRQGITGAETVYWNLPPARLVEMALREEQKQKMGGSGKSPGSRGQRKPNQDPSNQPGKGNSPPQDQPKQGQQSPNPQDQQAKPQPGQGQPLKPGEGQDARLPQFRNQPDMNAQEAAAVLSAVENLERQQRRDQAAHRARQQSAKGKDW